MKKSYTLLILCLACLGCLEAQNVYVLGQCSENTLTVSAVYKNGEKQYTSLSDGTDATPKVLVCDSEENVYWMVNRPNHTEIYKNDQMYLSTENHSNINIADIYCLHDTLYYAGFQKNENNVLVATVWKGNDFTPYWIMGDGVHPSRIFDADIDKWTGIPYFCGYTTDDITRACVWKESDLLYTCQDTFEAGYNFTDTIIHSYASEISVDDGCVYSKGYIDTSNATYDLLVLWTNGRITYTGDGMNNIWSLCASNGRLYYCEVDEPTIYFGVIGLHLMLNIYESAGLHKVRETYHDIYVAGMANRTAAIWKNNDIFQRIDDCDAAVDVFVAEPVFPIVQSEWYYEIQNENGIVTYQHLEYAADTTIGTQGPKIIVRTNTIYDRDDFTATTREYVYEEDGIVYWWNKDLEGFTTLYNLNAQADDEWEIKVGTESITMHVDSVEYYEYEGRNYRMLHVSDPEDLFSGDIVCGIGHLTSFFPERLMNRGKGYRVESLRCFWVDGTMVFKMGDKDCDAVYEKYHHGIDDKLTENGMAVYPNPANNVLFVETRLIASLPTQIEYRITNLMGQILWSGLVETHYGTSLQAIDVSSLPAGMYFINVGEQTLRFVKR